jgi:hypothetical protein
MLHPAPEDALVAAKLAYVLPSLFCKPSWHHSHCQWHLMAAEEFDQPGEIAPWHSYIVRSKKNDHLTVVQRFRGGFFQTGPQSLVDIGRQIQPQKRWPYS